MKKRMVKICALVLTAGMLTGTAAAQETAGEMPWKNTNIDGAVTEEVSFEQKDDFYGAVNRDWLIQTELETAHVGAGSFVERQDEIDDNLMALFEDRTLESHDAKLLQGLYDLFLDWDSRNELGMTPLIPHLEQLQQVETLDQLTEYLKSEEALYYGNSMFPFSVGTKADDPDWYELQINTFGLSLMDAAEYKQMTMMGMLYKNAIDDLNRYLLGKAGYESKEAETIMKNAFAYERAMAKGMMSYAELTDPASLQEVIHPVTLEELRELSPSFPLVQIMEANGYDGWERINLSQPKWLETVNELYTEENFDNMKAYLVINFLQSNASFLDEETYRKIQSINRQLTGAQESSSDEEIAYNFAGSILTDCISRLYVETYVSEETKEEITAIIEEVIDTYRDMLQQEDWLSEETREKAIRKLDHIKINAAYPDKWDDTDDLTFTTKEEGGTLWQAMEELSEIICKKQFVDNMNQKADPELWDFSVAQANAYYDASDNSINIIAGILGEPFYTTDMSEEEKLAGIGMIIGHEISHAFDTGGAQFDETGALANWWTDEDLQAFSDRAAKLIAYYDQIVPQKGTSYSGTQVQMEAIADMAGVKCMLEMAKKIEDFDYDAFFRGVAKVWRSKYTKEYEAQLIQYDTHPLDYLRVNVTLMQMPEFYETYGIVEGNGMYLPEDERLSVW